MMKFFLAGASGFTGRALINRVVKKHSLFEVVAHVRPESTSSFERLRQFESKNFSIAKTRLSSKDELIGFMEGCEAIVQFIGTTSSHAKRGENTYLAADLGTTIQLIEAAQHAQVPRFLFLSGLMLGSGGPFVPDEFFRAKLKAEAAVRSSDLAWTIWRPAFITGPGRNRPKETFGVAFVRPLAWVFRKLGAKNLGMRLRPITSDQLASSFENVLLNPINFEILEGESMWKTVLIAN